ncbi:receptor-type tyrosine-protein phosphatase T-like isoform X2 [Asterias amurensis]
MNTTTSYTATQEDLRWKHDGEFKTEWNGQAAVTIFSVQATDAGIYECYEMLRHGDQKHGIMKLIVRECGLYNWDPPSCNKACPACHNGGVCDDLTGECICAPGFSGDFCETLLGKNYFGQDGGITCSTKTDVACRNNLMCLPDPFGCTCAASFTGLNCESDCPAGLFGAGCRQRCHCASGVACNYGHGRCPGECENGYRGENCQNSCPYGQIGVNCIDCTVPVEVKNPSITSVNNQRVISWAVASNMCPVSDYTVQYELITRDQCQQVSDTFMDVDTTENLQFVLQESDLESSTFVPYSTYKIRVRARNEAGLGLYLNDVNNDEFITAERAPSAPPANVTHLNVTDVGAIIQWDEVPCGSRGGYLIEYSYELTKSDGTSMIEVTSARSLSFHDLHPCSDYTFRVAARTSVDIGVYSNEMSFSTEAKAHTPVENLSTNETENTLAVTWDATDVTENPCSLLYKIEYELINRDQCEPISSPVRSEGVNQTTPGITLDGLDAYSTYTVYVWTWSEAGLSEERSLNSTTAGKVPSAPPGNVTHLNLTETGVSFQWDEVLCGSRGGAIAEYSYELMTSSGNGNRSETTAERSLSFSDLLPCTEYKFKVAAKTSLGTGIYSQEIVFITSTKAHPAVSNLSTTEKDDALEVTWDATDVTENPCSLLYKIEYELINRDQCEPISSPVRSEGVNQTTPGITLDGLDAYSTYTVYVWTWSEAGLSEERSLNSTTAGKAPSAPPANIKHLNLTETGVSFQWDEVPCGSRGGVIAEYSYKLTTSSGLPRTATTTARSLSFNDLLPCSKYKFKVAATTSIDVGTYTEEIEFTTLTKAHLPVENLSTTETEDTLAVTWDATDVTENPCSLLYKIEYELINRDQCEPISSPVRSEGVNQTTPGIILDGLDAYSTYTVYVWTWSEAGLSEERSESSTTSSKAPDESPAGFELADKTKTSIAVSWTTVPCGNRNGEIVGYWMRYKILDKPYDKSFDPSQEEYTEEKLSIFEKNVTGLKPSTQYDIQVAGRVLIGVDEVVGPYATMKIYTSVETDIEKPKEPTVDTSLTTSSTVTIALTPPAVSTYVTDFQIGVLLITPSSEGNKKRRDVSPDLYVAGEFSKDNLPEIFQVGDDKMYGEYRNKPLESSAVYDIYLAALSKTTDQEAAIAWGDPSRVEVGSGDLGSDPFPVAAVIVPILVIIVVGVVAGGLFLKRRANQDKQSDSEGLQVDEIKEEKQRYTSTHSAKDNFSSVDEGIAMMATTSINHPPSPAKPKPRKKTFRAPTAISLTEFEEFIHKKKAETVKEGNGFLWDFKNLPDEVLYSCSVAKEDENKKLNRYANIIPYDDSRVILQKLANDPTSSDYVNASYIDGFNAPKQYIATQGPNTASVPDMWRMIWQENCTKIVMLTNLLEGVKGKCEQYWPDKALSYGKITVTLVKEVKRVDYIIRDFSLSHEAEDQQSRKVRQFHYTTWPDMGLPQDPSKVVDLVKIVKEYSPNSCGPMVVHCSAGVGRTGTFIILDAMLDQAKAEGKVDVWNFARGMRDRRMKMIQTSAQYEFVFDALLDEFQCGDKTIKAEELRSKLSALKKIQASSHKTGIQLEFESLDKLASHTSTSSHQYRGGQDPDNVDKNRFPEIVPVDRLRPRLMTAGGAGTTDYINASFLNSYSAKSGYITTQMPLPQTVGDLWRMAYDYNATFIVMLNSMDDKTFADYLPTKDEPSTVGPLSVTLESTDQLESGITMRKLKLTNQKMKESRKICHLQLSDWPDVSGVPASPISTLQAVTAVHQWQKDHGNEDRIIIHCIDGVRASGTFCALLNIMAKLKDGNVVDVYRAVMKVKGTRAGMVPTLEHYSFLYGAVQNHLDTSIVYENL